MKHNPIANVLISVSDKSNLHILTQALDGAHNNLRILASDGSYNALQGKTSASLQRISDYTQQAVGKRVKTLDFRIFAGILSEDREEFFQRFGNDAIFFDMVVCNLYAFQANAFSSNTILDACEQVDIGGMSLIRAAAKNFMQVAVVSRPEQYTWIANEIKETATLSLRSRYRLCCEAFSYTAACEEEIARYFSHQEFDDATGDTDETL